MHLELKHIPFVEHKPNREIADFTANDIMSSNVYSFREIETVHNIIEALVSTEHCGFPIVRNDDNTYKGTITRNQIVILLKNGV